MIVNSIERGIVIDHITAGTGNKILDYLKIDTKKNTVAFIMNATSEKHGRKDIIKIENVTDVDLTVLGLLDPNATVNIIENGEIVKKINLELPKKVVNVIKCKNPRCVTSVERNAQHIFHLMNEETREYRCEYCDDIVSMKAE
ncbi:MAG: aspartate carbamoyltransferase regulatory subunit [Clostridiales bacterium]|nr:aspartate carbamoyltransferase regulatory subunit [Clostridiales bacterium]